MKLCERLRELRSERNLRLKDVAARSGLSVPYLSDLERGRTNPSLDTLCVLAATYEITVHDVLHGIDWYGQEGTGALPVGLQDLLSDPVLGAQVTPDWVRTLARIELRGRRPRDKADWYALFAHLRRILD